MVVPFFEFPCKGIEAARGQASANHLVLMRGAVFVGGGLERAVAVLLDDHLPTVAIV